ncbi:EbsA family protein [Companilactobacillus metriopterae]|uniref:EbsA family protein n=1 Tax=Companilactobacillus metriopterae TaxID=1909267 RepID=UPI00100C1AC8|nr:EbsA family protein [Companilactobacillus metriopterae]
MKKKIYIQASGSWGIILWSILLIIIFLGIIVQLEKLSFTIVPIIIWVFAALYLGHIIFNSWIKIENNKFWIKLPMFFQARSFDLEDVTLEKTKSFKLNIIFNNHDYFPQTVLLTKKNLNKLLEEID